MKLLLVVVAALSCSLAASAVTLEVCTTSSSVQGDPHFVGFNGQRFEFQGSDGGIYNILTAPTTQVNALFIGNSQWGNERTFVSAVGIQEGSATQISVGCQNAALVATVNGVTVEKASPVSEGQTTVHLTSDEAVIALPAFEVRVFRAKNRWESCYLNLDLSMFKSNLDISQVHGVIGQTAAIAEVAQAAEKLSKFEDGAFSLEGTPQDYSVAEGHLFGNSFRFNRFKEQQNNIIGSRNLLATSRALLQDPQCSVCDGSPCAGQPDGMHSCGYDPNNIGFPECFGTDPSVYCAPSGCAGGSSSPSGGASSSGSDSTCVTEIVTSCWDAADEASCNESFRNNHPCSYNTEFGYCDELSTYCVDPVPTGTCTSRTTTVPYCSASSDQTTCESSWSAENNELCAWVNGNCQGSYLCNAGTGVSTCTGFGEVNMCSNMGTESDCNNAYTMSSGYQRSCSWSYGYCSEGTMCELIYGTGDCTSKVMAFDCYSFSNQSECEGAYIGYGSNAKQCTWDGWSCSDYPSDYCIPLVPTGVCVGLTETSSCTGFAGEVTCVSHFTSAGYKCTWSASGNYCEDWATVCGTGGITGSGSCSSLTAVMTCGMMTNETDCNNKFSSSSNAACVFNNSSYTCNDGTLC